MYSKFYYLFINLWKLPYNLTEDPWRAAQNFIHQNAVSIAYLEEVANFIISNTAAAREERAVSVVDSGPGGAADPLTGGSGYKPDYAAPKKKSKGGFAIFRFNSSNSMYKKIQIMHVYSNNM